MVVVVNGPHSARREHVARGHEPGRHMWCYLGRGKKNQTMRRPHACVCVCVCFVWLSDSCSSCLHLVSPSPPEPCLFFQVLKIALKVFWSCTQFAVSFPMLKLDESGRPKKRYHPSRDQKNNARYHSRDDGEKKEKGQNIAPPFGPSSSITPASARRCIGSRLA